MLAVLDAHSFASLCGCVERAHAVRVHVYVFMHALRVNPKYPRELSRHNCAEFLGYEPFTQRQPERSVWLKGSSGRALTIASPGAGSRARRFVAGQSFAFVFLRLWKDHTCCLLYLWKCESNTEEYGVCTRLDRSLCACTSLARHAMSLAFGLD